MILKGSQRAYGQELAVHLLNDRDNDHVALHELRGFSADDLPGAFEEAHAVSLATRCQQYLFSLSLNPPPLAQVSVETFERAIDRIEGRLGLSGQPRAVLFHEKEGRRHAHVVWSRISGETLKAVHLPHYKLKLTDISRELYREQGWDTPRGLADTRDRDPLNFTFAEWQQAKRRKADPKALKAMFAECWESSDSRAGFENALTDKGFALAKGDKRGFVAVDIAGEVYSLTRWLGQNAKTLSSKLGKPDDLPDVGTAHSLLLKVYDRDEAKPETPAREMPTLERSAIAERRIALVSRQRAERESLKGRQEKRAISEAKVRASRLPRGLKSLWSRVTGQYRELIRQNAADAENAKQRDRSEWQALIDWQLAERLILKREFEGEREHTHARHRKPYPELQQAFQNSVRPSPPRDEDTTPHVRRRTIDR